MIFNWIPAALQRFSTGQSHRKSGRSRKFIRQMAAEIMPLEERLMLSGTNLADLPRGDSFIYNPAGYLSGPASGAPESIASNFLATHSSLIGLTAQDVSDLTITSQYTDQPSGTTHIYFRQQYQGIEVATADMSVAVTSDGRVLSIGNQMIVNLATRIDSTSNLSSNRLSANQAVSAAARSLGLAVPAVESLIGASGTQERQIFSGGQISRNNIPTKLMYQPGGDGRLHLAWNMSISMRSTDDWYDLNVDARTGEVLSQVNWTHYESASGSTGKSGTGASGSTVTNSTNTSGVLPGVSGLGDIQCVRPAERCSQ